MNNQREISLGEVLRRLRGSFLWLLLAGIIFCAGTVAVTKFMVKPVYRSTASVYVYTNPKTQDQGSISNADLVAATNFVKSCEYFIQRSDDTKEKVMDYVKENYPELESVSATQLSKMVEIQSVTDTQILTITVKSENRELAKAVAEAYAETIPDEIVRTTKVGGATIFEQAKIAKKPVSPSLIKNALIGFLIGVVLMAAIVLIRWFCDSAVYTEGDIESTTDVPVLASIPDFSGIAAEDEKKSHWNAGKGGAVGHE